MAFIKFLYLPFAVAVLGSAWFSYMMFIKDFSRELHFETWVS
ncbi:hypothetical protein N018_12205 [Pseudomonas syringae CC1557]|uniref:Uncharacterized protein n=1 Tax=Pseudomonas syringae CC1557 TaxID=1357279 RepID=W0N2R4_PSESX|nr:hypothetical protein N018_12205 [Pseudomonas syringae CC1557]